MGVLSTFSTIRTKIQTFFHPLSSRWRAFRTRKPWLSFSALLAFWGILFIPIGVAFLFTLVYYGFFGPLPTYSDLRAVQNDEASEVYGTHEVLLGKYFVQNRVNANLEELSPYLINALVATEDARFFQHSGIDPRALVRVIIRTILLGDEGGGGGSTLSQQLAKNLFDREEYGLLTIPVVKIREMIIARRLENIYSKEELLHLYLNTVPFSDNVYGVKVAAQRFFNRSVADLQVEEAALLIGTLKGNSMYSPIRHPERATQRRNVVLGQMEKYGYLDSLSTDSLQAQPIQLAYQSEGNNQGLATYFREHLRLELGDILDTLKKPDGENYNLYTDGLKIFTTIDPGLQGYAEEAVGEHMAELQKTFDDHWKAKRPYSRKLLERAVAQSDRYQRLVEAGVEQSAIEAQFAKPVSMEVFNWGPDSTKLQTWSPLDSIQHYLSLLHAGFLVMDPQTGAIRAWVGGIDHSFFQYDHVKSKRQVGSTFKPLVYSTALVSGYSPCEYILNELTTYTDYEDWEPKNSDGEYGGYYSMAGGLAQSVNTVAVEWLFKVGIDSVRQLAAEMGIKGPIDDAPAIALGAVEASLYEMVQVYGTLANRGNQPTPYYIERIEDAEGRVLFNRQAKDQSTWKEVIPMDEADLLIRMLQGVMDRGTGARLRTRYGVWGQVAGKTGTTQDQSDGWYLGFTPNLVGGVWVGAESPSVHWRSLGLGQGANTALPIWGLFLKKVYQDPKYKSWQGREFVVPDSIVLQQLDCPSFREDLDGLFFDLDGENQGLNKIFNIFRRDRNEEKQPTYDNPIRVPNSSDPNLSPLERERLRQQEERLRKKEERAQKRKEFWKNAFGNEEQ